jgi:signal transduction histidine kinase/CheY-like chemotaxis protein
MNIKVHTSIVLLVCTLSGVALGTFLMLRSRGIDDDLRRVGPTSATMRDVELLGEALGQWLTTNDLVLNQDQSFMVASSMQQCGRLRRLLSAIEETPLVGDQRAEVAGLRGNLDELQELVRQARDLRSEDRAARLAEIAKAADARSTIAVERTAELERTLKRRAAYMMADLADQQQVLRVLGWLAATLYLGIVWLCWLWTVHRVVGPIEELSRATERAAEDENEFLLAQDGPSEVTQLARSFRTFVAKLQDAKAHTEEQVRQRTAELVQANQAKAQFVATMSHELRTPLNGIINMNELILDTDLDSEQAGFARTAKSAAEALLTLINDILDFSKIEARKLELESVEFEPRELVDSAIEILAGVATAKGLEVQAVVAPDVPTVLRGDPMRLRQIVINLLNNALKFTAKGSIGIHVRTEGAVGGDAVLRFEVRDTGIGIPPERRQLLFQAFQQADATTTRKYGGTGLGLAICKELSALMQGNIGVESAVGVGSTFWFTARLGGAAVTETVTIDLDGAEAVLVTRRELLAARWSAQLRHLGVPPEDMLVLADAAELPADASRRRFVLVDPYGEGVDPKAILATVRNTAGVAVEQVAVLDHWLRHWPAQKGPPPANVIRIAEPTKADQLRAWLEEELDPSTWTRNTPAPAQAAAPADAQRAPAVASTGRRILVAEDNEVNRSVILAVLKRGDFVVTVAKDGSEAVEAFRREPFDLVIMDCQMPVMDGIEATRHIRSLEVERTPSSALPQHVPIVALTANAREEISKECLAAGMNRFMTKPFRPHVLLDTIAELLAARGSASPARASSRPRVLVADDNPINRRVAESVLARSGYEVILVEDGQQAVDHLTRSRVDVVLMDCEMPVLDGAAAAARIRELEARGGLAPGCPARLPIVAVSGHAPDSEQAAALTTNMDRYVTKPFKPKELVAVVAALTGSRADPATTPAAPAVSKGPVRPGR